MSDPNANPHAPGLHTYTGSCHCGAVRFEVDIDLEATGTTRCNCTWCTKHGWWGAIVKPGAFRLTGAPGAVRQTNPYGSRYACETCGVLVYGRGELDQLGGPFVSFNVRTLDDVDLEGVPIQWFDGLANTWAPLAKVRHHFPWRPASD